MSRNELAVTASWLCTAGAVLIGAVTHRNDVGTIALFCQLAFSLRGWIQEWIEREGIER